MNWTRSTARLLGNNATRVVSRALSGRPLQVGQVGMILIQPEVKGKFDRFRVRYSMVAPPRVRIQLDSKGNVVDWYMLVVDKFNKGKALEVIAADPGVVVSLSQVIQIGLVLEYGNTPDHALEYSSMQDMLAIIGQPVPDSLNRFLKRHRRAAGASLVRGAAE